MKQTDHSLTVSYHIPVLRDKMVQYDLPVDVDECASGLHTCAQTCVNTVGGFECSCTPGFIDVNHDGRMCEGEYRQNKTLSYFVHYLS